jgi:katanin p60 ATPase-containing subunit A1
MSSLSLRRLKLSSESRTAELDKQQLLKKQTLFLIHHHLNTNGYHITAQQLYKEASLSEKDVIADNIDLLMVVEEFQEYYMSKFGKMPKIFRKGEQ